MYRLNLYNSIYVKLLNTLFFVHRCDSFIRIKPNNIRNKIEIIQTKWYEMHFMIEKYLYLLITVVEYLKNNNIN